MFFFDMPQLLNVLGNAAEISSIKDRKNQGSLGVNENKFSLMKKWPFHSIQLLKAVEKLRPIIH